MAASSFTFFASYYAALQYLPVEDCGQMIKAICEFALNDVEPNFEDPILKGYWTLIRPTLEVSIKRSQAGRRGGQSGAGVSRNQGNSNASKTIANVEQNNSKTIEDKDKDKDKEMELGVGVGVGMEIGQGNKKEKKSSRRFVTPTVEEVNAYMIERGDGLNAQQFIDFYTAKGWKIGNSPMKDWKAAVRTWEQRNGFDPKKKPTPKPQVRLGVGEYIDNDGNRRYSPNLPPVPMDAPPRPSNDLVWSKETNTWIPPLC